MPAAASKASDVAAKRGTGESKAKSDDTKSNSSTSVGAAGHAQGALRNQTLKMISEVDESNIEDTPDQTDDVPQGSKAFVTEVQQDQVYNTIFRELQKKVPHKSAQKSSPSQVAFAEQGQSDQQILSPDLLAANDDDDMIETEMSIADESLSIASSERNASPSQDGYDTDIESEVAVHEDHDITGRTQYLELCSKSKLIPCSYFMAHIQDKEMSLRYHQFSDEDVRAIAKTLCSNISVERLMLDGNCLQRAAAKHISRMIIVNDFITELSLADNNLGGGEGTKEVCRMLTLSRYLRKINLSGNRFNDADAAQLIDAFEQSKVLRELDLSNNNFGEECGKPLGTFISSNESLESIDLSWNNIRGRSAIEIANGIKENVRLKRCNIEMNGFGPDGGEILAECIKQNSALEEFNISSNRLNTSNAFAIAVSLISNDSLQIFKIGNNQINSDGALAIFLCIKSNETSALREIDFSHTVVTEETYDVCQDIVKLKSGKFKYITGKVTPKILKSNALTECYVKTDESLLNKLRANAANAKPHIA